MEEDTEIANTNEKKTYTDPITGKFVKGNPGGGRPKGTENFSTKWYKMVDKIASQNNLTADEIDEQLLLVGYKNAKDGNFSFYSYVMDRIYGKSVQPTTIEQTVNIASVTDRVKDIFND